MNISFPTEAWEHFLYWQQHDRAILRKINALIRECQRHPSEGTGKPEPLKGVLSGHWSRRITREHRLVYKPTRDAIIIVQCRLHH